jgi:hypothetical protein
MSFGGLRAGQLRLCMGAAPQFWWRLGATPLPARQGLLLFSLAVLVSLCLWKEHMSTTRKVAGIDLGPKSFLVVPDPADSSGWRLPIFVPGDAKLTMNLVKNACARFHQTQGIPTGQRSALWNRLVGAAIVLGIPVAKDPVVVFTDEEIDLLLAERQASELVGKLSLDWTKE